MANLTRSTSLAAAFSNIPVAPIGLVLVSYLFRAYATYVDVRRCHCRP